MNFAALYNVRDIREESVNESLAQAGISLFIIPIRGFDNIFGYFWEDP